MIFARNKSVKPQTYYLTVSTVMTDRVSDNNMEGVTKFCNGILDLREERERERERATNIKS